MKFRYLMLPMIIVSLMVFILDNEKSVVNKEFLSDSLIINYPFFDNDDVDNYISLYLQDYYNKENVLIDYDCIDKDGLYYVTFYKYIFDGNMVNSDIDCLIIDFNEGTVNIIDGVFNEYNIIQNEFVDGNDKLVALTFDDGPNYNTNKVLDVLDKYNVTATFFVVGSKISGNEYILERMIREGNEIGNHTFNHLLLSKYDIDKIEEEINNTSNLIFDVVGKYPSLLRTSYGTVNNNIKKVSNYPIIIWNIDTLDWKYHNSKKITNRVLKKVSDGDIVLMHDVYSATSNALYTIIPKLQAEGYRFVTVSELFYYKGITLENGKVYFSAE